MDKVIKSGVEVYYQESERPVQAVRLGPIGFKIGADDQNNIHVTHDGSPCFEQTLSTHLGGKISYTKEEFGEFIEQLKKLHSRLK